MLTLIPMYATFSTLVWRVPLRNTLAHPDFGSTNSVVSATGLLRQRERVVQPVIIANL